MRYLYIYVHVWWIYSLYFSFPSQYSDSSPDVPRTLHLTISVIPTKSEANIDWLFAISFHPIIDNRLSFSYVSDYSFLPILNISPFKIMCISPPPPAMQRFFIVVSRASLTSCHPLRANEHTVRVVLPSLRGTPGKGF